MHLAQVDELWESPQRRFYIEQALLELRVHLVLAGDKPVGYAVLRHDWFGWPFLEMLVVHPDHRRQGAGGALLRHLLAGLEGFRVFASANRSNLAMQSLLKSLGFIESGVIHNLDEGDPELVFVKLQG